MYTFESRVRYSEVGEDCNMTITSLLDYFQDCSTFHSEDIGLGLAYYRQRGEAWVLSAWQICVNRYPHLCERIVIGTAPYDFKGFIGYRNFEMKTQEGEVLAYANSVWSLMNMEKMIPARVEPETVGRYGTYEKYPMEYAPRKICVPEDGISCEPFTVKTQHLDTNHHVNNGQYVKMAMDYMPKDIKARQLRVEYKSQAHLDDEVYPVLAEQEGRYTVSLNDGEKKPYCIVELLGQQSMCANGDSER